jgi:hypothetical protein
VNLSEFISKFDQEDSIVLLEGKRNVLEEDQEKLIALGKLLALRTSKIIFRSGNASGADHYFCKGVTMVDPKRLQVVVPYSDHRKKSNIAYDTISLDDIDLISEPEVIYQSKGNKKTKKLVDEFVAGNKNRFSIKAAYIIRDTIKAIGAEGVRPASFGIFYDDLDNPREGGTGHTMNICELNRIPIIDQKVWKNWLLE